MKKVIRQSLFISGILAGCLAIGVAATCGSFNSFEKAKADTYTLTLNSSNAPTNLTGSYQDNITQTVKTTNGNDVQLNFVGAKLASNAYVQLMGRGMITNVSPIHGITGVSVTSNGTIYARSMLSDFNLNPGYTMTEPITLQNGVQKTIPATNNLQLIAEGETTITEIKYIYSCSSVDDITVLNGSYTGYGEDTDSYKMTFNNGAVTLVSLDKQSNVSFSGSATISGNEVTLSFNNIVYKMTLSNDKYNLNYKSKSGSNQSAIPELRMFKVYNVDDFESYTRTGVGYDQSNGIRATSGLRANYYAEYYAGSGNAPIGGNNWKLMGSTDYLTYSSNLGRNSSKTAIFKGNGNSLRYIQMNSLYGIPEIIGRGTELSFWAKGPYGDKDFSTNASVAATVTIYAFYNSQLEVQTVQSDRTEASFTIPIGSGWTRYSLSLDPSKDYYSVGIFCKQSGTTYVPIDDIEIYTVSPYATYVAPYTEPVPTAPYANQNLPDGSFWGLASVNGNNVSITISLGSNGYCAVKLANTDPTITGVTYNTSTKKLTISTSGSYLTRSYGNITATYEPSTNRLINVGCSGTIKSYISGNGSIVLSAPAAHWECNETTFALRDVFQKRQGSPWVQDAGIKAITSNTSVKLGGAGAVRMSGNSSARVALNLAHDFNTPVSAENIGFWVYNPSNSDISIGLWIFTSANFETNKNPASFTAKAKKWTYCCSGFGSVCSVYNIQLADMNSTGVPLTFDNIMLY